MSFRTRSFQNGNIEQRRRVFLARNTTREKFVAGVQETELVEPQRPQSSPQLTLLNQPALYWNQHCSLPLRRQLMSKFKSVGAIRLGAAAIGAFALGAFAIGALAIGRVAIGRFIVGKSTLKSLKIGELTVKHLRVGDLDVTRTLNLPPGVPVLHEHSKAS
jgi:hypothetical protein